MNFDEPHPSFERPPVSEVVASVAFDRLALTAGHLGKFWSERLAADFPELEEQPAYEPPMEASGRPIAMSLRFELTDRPPTPRLWAKSRQGTRLLQMQSDWFAVNWRSAPGSDQPYPRWPSIESTFVENLTSLEGFTTSSGFGTLAVRQCEVTYVNEIDVGGAGLDTVLETVGASPAILGQSESMQVVAAYPLYDSSDQWRGRLHFTAQPALRRLDGAPVLVLNLTARLSPLNPSHTAALEAVRLGHVWVVNGFAAMTTAEMHERWGRTA